MEMTGEYRIPATRERVWEALNDPAVLQLSIPGCESLEKTSENGYAATVTAKVGPVKAKFSGQVTLSDLDPPNSYTISGEGKGGAAGFAKGDAKIQLIEDGGETVLKYEVHANVGGKLAQLGSRLIDGTSRKLAGEFFTSFSEQAAGVAPTIAAAEEVGTPGAAIDIPAAMVEAAAGTAEAAPELLRRAPQQEPQAEIPAYRGIPTWTWVTGLILLVVLLLLILS